MHGQRVVGGAPATEKGAKCFGASGGEKLMPWQQMCVDNCHFSKIDGPKIWGRGLGVGTGEGGDPEFDESEIHQNLDLDASSRFFGSSVLLPR